MSPISSDGPPRVLVAGIGNIFMGDDAFGVEVARQLLRQPLPDGVRVTDFGIRSYDLAYALMEPYEAVILVDAVPRGEPPGTLFLIEPDLQEGASEAAFVDAHSLNPAAVLQMVRSLGGSPGRILLVGCEPFVLETEDGALGLSEPVRRAVPEAVAMTLSVIEDVLTASS